MQIILEVLEGGFNLGELDIELPQIGRIAAVERNSPASTFSQSPLMTDTANKIGITVPGYPNFFIIYGPNTNLAHGGSAIFHSECQIRYAMEGIRELVESGARSIECRREPFEAYQVKVDDALKQMVWSHPAMSNWAGW
ncbi:MAG: hypothetical protein GEU90_23050 [Gemmatimonas sp.]|nr:hypothetical protein [Gemmatimonas sp.]